MEPGKIEVGVRLLGTKRTIIAPSTVFRFPVVPAFSAADVIDCLLDRLLPRVDYLAAAIAFGFPRSIVKLVDHATIFLSARSSIGTLGLIRGRQARQIADQFTPAFKNGL